MSDLNQHLRSQTHIAAALRFDARPERQILLNELPAAQRCEFIQDLCEAFVAADIPWNKLKNEKFKDFLEKYTGRKVPDESTPRKTYLKPLYIKVLVSV